MDRLGRRRLGRPASSRLRAEGIRDMLSPNADCGVIWLHTPGSISDSSMLILLSSSWGLTLQRRKEPFPVTSFLVRWELSTSRIPCSSKWGMPSTTS